MKKTDQWSGGGLLILAGFICWGSASLTYGNIHNPGAGFFPRWLGIILGAMAIGLILKAAWQRQGAKGPGEIPPGRVRWEKVLFVLLALVLYGALLNTLGFLIVTVLLLAFLLRFIELQPWKTVIGWTLLASLGSYLIFELWMKLRLPKGFLGI